MPRISGPSLVRNGEDGPQTVRAAQAQVLARARRLIAFALAQSAANATFLAFEMQLFGEVCALARAVVALFLAASEERVLLALEGRVVLEGRTFRRAPAQTRNLLTWFGVVRYRRTYLREVVEPGEPARGFHPLDAALGLMADRISPNVLSIAARLATRMSFADAHALLRWFLPVSPSTEVIESTVLGYGRSTQEWFEAAPPPDGDGDVLVVQFDSKGVPTATDEELRKRRGKRSKKKRTPSPRHRGRQKRGRRTKKPRRKKGDKAKNAKMGTMVVMYTLRKQPGGSLLLGPINKRYYASFAPKRHAIEIGRREATKRGFPPGTKRLVQALTDGDNDLARYVHELFPDAIHTIDVMHVVEKLWDAGSSVHREGTPECHAWVEKQKAALYAGKASEIVAEFEQQLAQIAKTGPGNKYRRSKLTEIGAYLGKRTSNMTYDDLIARDLEIGTGAVEGAIKNLMYKRMDQGGMRWIKERAEALLQLRCIDANGDWDAFTKHVHEKARATATRTGERIRIQQRHPAPLPRVAAEILCDAA
jgi:hypothetical protein